MPAMECVSCTALAPYPPPLSPARYRGAYIENQVSMDTVEREAKKGGGDEDTGRSGAASAPPWLNAAPIAGAGTGGLECGRRHAWMLLETVSVTSGE